MLSKIIRNDIMKMSRINNITAGFVTSELDKKDIFKLRYDVMVRDTQTFPKTHYCIHNDEFKDEYDEHPSTKHYLVRKNGIAVASCRLIDRNKVEFEAEKFKWFPVTKELEKTHTNPINCIEPTRVVVCKSVRKSHISVFMLADNLLYIHDNKFESVLGLVNSNASSLINHYQKFMPSLLPLSKGPFSVNEFIEGRSCAAFNLYIGTSEEQRKQFMYSTIFKCFLYYNFLYYKH